MYTAAEIIFFVFVGILGCLLITLAVLNIINDRKQKKEYQEYVESIKIGDTFGHDLFKVYDVDDPFSENYGTLGFDSRYYATILDIKKNNKGETWVKYCFTKNINNPNHATWSDEINDFLKHRTRLSKRIDNINTNE
jgi:hypothetical protein